MKMTFQDNYIHRFLVHIQNGRGGTFEREVCVRGATDDHVLFDIVDNRDESKKVRFIRFKESYFWNRYNEVLNVAA